MSVLSAEIDSLLEVFLYILRVFLPMLGTYRKGGRKLLLFFAKLKV